MSTGLQTNNHYALMHVIQFVSHPVDIHRTITHNRMQFNAYIFISKSSTHFKSYEVGNSKSSTQCTVIELVIQNLWFTKEVQVH